MMVKRLLLISLIATFIMYEVAFTFFLDTSSVYAQSSIAISRYVLLIALVLSIKTTSIITYTMVSCFIGYWVSAIIKYLFNAYLFPDFQDWMHNFNEWPLYRMIFVFSYIVLLNVIRWKSSQ